MERDEMIYHERRVVTQSEKSQTQPVQDVDHSRDAGIFAKRNDALAALVHHFFVVNKSNILLLIRKIFWKNNIHDCGNK